MTTTYDQVISTRTTAKTVQIVATFNFEGDGAAQLDQIKALFTDAVAKVAREHGQKAVAEIDRVRAADEAAMHQAVVNALGKVSPKQRAHLIERYGLSVGAVQ